MTRLATDRTTRRPSRSRCSLSALVMVGLLAMLPRVAGAALVSESTIAREAEYAFEQMKAQIPISRNIADRDYVSCVAGMLIAQLDEPFRSLDWEIELFEHQAANAFAMPGGKIGVYTGIFAVADNQDSLAAVIGHEIVHVVAQHSLKRARKQVRNHLLVAAATGMLGGGGGTATALSLGAEIGLNRPYDRKQESRADAEGLELMADAGFNPLASVRLWKNMTKKNPASPPEFLSTHPDPANRIDDLISQLATSLARYNAAVEAGRVPQCE